MQECGLTQPVLSRTRTRIGVHIGPFLNSGHYVAYVRQPGDTWVCADDETITEVGTGPKRLSEAEMCDFLSCQPTLGSVFEQTALREIMPGDGLLKPRTVALYAPGPNQVRPLVFPSRFLGVFGRFTRVDAAANVADYPPPPPSRGVIARHRCAGWGASLHLWSACARQGRYSKTVSPVMTPSQHHTSWSGRVGGCESREPVHLRPREKARKRRRTDLWHRCCRVLGQGGRRRRRRRAGFGVRGTGDENSVLGRACAPI